VAEQVRAEGLRLVDCSQMTNLFQDPRCEQGLVVFIDARNDEHYQEGHIPGAYQLDHFYPERYLAATLPVCQTAEQILIYCNGGACDDSLQTAIFLRDAGIPRERLFIYAGGITEWTAKGLPVETGARKSGSLLPNK
jgi:rhodanese-related sulfurtransferase